MPLKALRLLLSLALLALVLWFAHWRSVLGVLKEVDARWVLAAVLLGIADRLICNYRWQILLAARGVSVGFLRLFGVQLAANFWGAISRRSASTSSYAMGCSATASTTCGSASRPSGSATRGCARAVTC